MRKTRKMGEPCTIDKRQRGRRIRRRALSEPKEPIKSGLMPNRARRARLPARLSSSCSRKLCPDRRKRRRSPSSKRTRTCTCAQKGSRRRSRARRPRGRSTTKPTRKRRLNPSPKDMRIPSPILRGRAIPMVKDILKLNPAPISMPIPAVRPTRIPRILRPRLPKLPVRSALLRAASRLTNSKPRRPIRAGAPRPLLDFRR